MSSPSLITSALFIYFPRELRDKVYSEIWDTSTVANLPYMGPLRASRKSTGAPYPAHLKPNFLDHASLFAAEVVEWLYTKSPDFAPRVHGFQDVPLYLQTDVLDVGVIPLSLPIHQFSIRFFLRELSSPQMRTAHPFQAQLNLLLAAEYTKQSSIDIQVGNLGTQKGRFQFVELHALGHILKPLMVKIGETGGEMRVLYTRHNFRELDVTDVMGGTPKQLRKCLLRALDRMIADAKRKDKKDKLIRQKGRLGNEYFKGLRKDRLRKRNVDDLGEEGPRKKQRTLQEDNSSSMMEDES